MKVFDFTSGKKGSQLADIPRVAATGGWLVRKGEKVYKVTFTSEGKPRVKGANYEWCASACYAERDENEQRTGRDISIRPEDFGVGAICFCRGQSRDGTWDWFVIGTDEWNRAACVRGQLKAVFSHNMPSPEEEKEEADVF